MPIQAQTLRQLAEREERVFPSYPQVARYFPGGSIEDARCRLGRAIERGNGPGLVIGGPGTGKSLLLQVLAAHYHERFDVVLPACARLCTRRALLQSILFELGLPYRSRDEGELRLSLLDHLLSKEDCPTGLLLLIDEAQTLSIALLDELRVLTNLVRGGLPRVRLVLAGSSSLEEYFADPELESFSQRLSARCYLGPFTREETSQFIRAQLVASGATPENIFTPDAWSAVFEATDGVPRQVNQLCDRALTESIAAGHDHIDRPVIQRAWADIQQLPTPWDTPEPAIETPTSRVIEFGNLTGDETGHGSNSAWKDDDDQNDAVAGAILAEFDTALDIDDEPNVHCTHAKSSTDTSLPTAEPLKLAADPFGERFEEEEIVLDNFAAWDELFRGDTPRVANRRDPEFATLVEAALKAAPANDGRKNLPAAKSAKSSVGFDACERVGASEDDAAELDAAQLGVSADWPPLRIADISDVPTTSPLPTPAADEDPILIIEEDVAVLASPKPPVRREEYRHLFSRLRSG